MSFDTEIFGSKKFSDLLKDIYENQKVEQSFAVSGYRGLRFVIVQPNFHRPVSFGCVGHGKGRPRRIRGGADGRVVELLRRSSFHSFNVEF